MDDVVGMQDFKAPKDMKGHLPDEILAKLLVLLNLLFDEALGNGNDTARSPPSAYSMRIQRVLPNSSKKALLYEMMLGESIEARSRTSLSALSFSLALSCIILICFMA